MGSGASAALNSDAKLDLDAKDVDTPRGQTAKEEVKRLRTMLIERDRSLMQMLATARFREMDKDGNGFLENAELKHVVEWVMDAFGDKMGGHPDEVKTKLMHRLDSNKDGKLDLEEFSVLFAEMSSRLSLLERARAKFEELDSDKSGYLENAEIDAVIEWTMQAFTGEDPLSYKQRLIAKIDANQDGKLDKMEFTVLFEEMLTRIDLIKRAKVKFEELDEDKSGFLEKAEIDKLIELVLQAYSEKNEDERNKFKITLVKRLDVNGDGKLDILEFTNLFDEMLSRMDLIEKAEKKFKELDADGSGFLEPSELTDVVKTWCLACKNETGVDLEQSITELMNKIDVNGDGKLNLLEFVNIFEEIVAKAGIWG